ncbi:hypothetical protein D3C83_100400 [compost metagenome]
MALVLAPRQTSRAFATLDVDFVAQAAEPTRMPDAGLETIRTGVPAGHSLPLLAALALGSSETLALDCARDAHLRMKVVPCS